MSEVLLSRHDDFARYQEWTPCFPDFFSLPCFAQLPW